MNIKNHICAFAVSATYFRLSKAITGGGYEDGMPTQRADIDNVAVRVDLRLQPDLAGDMRDPGHLWVDRLNRPRPFDIRFLAYESGAKNYGYGYRVQYRLARAHGQGTLPQRGFCALVAYLTGSATEESTAFNPADIRRILPDVLVKQAGLEIRTPFGRIAWSKMKRGIYSPTHAHS